MSALQPPRHRYKKTLGWEVLFHILTEKVKENFPDADNYHSSLRAQFEDRIQEGHKADVKRLSELAEKYPAPADFDDWYSDDFQQITELTNIMSAAMIVSLWSDMEQVLKLAIRTCNVALNLSERALQEMQQFCDKSLKGEDPGAKYDKLNKAMETALRIPHEFPKIRGVIQQRSEVNCEHCAEYSRVNSIRILNNAFKHNAGRYRADPEKPTENIEPQLLARGIIKDNGEIDYTKLPIPELVSACNAFCHDLLSKIKKKLDNLGKT